MNFFKRILKYISHKYTKVQLVAVVVLCLFAFLLSESSIFVRIGYDTKIRNLNTQIEYYHQQTVQDKAQLELLNSSKENMEKFAREKYLMKKPDEDIFIVD